METFAFVVIMPPVAPHPAERKIGDDRVWRRDHLSPATHHVCRAQSLGQTSD